MGQKINFLVFCLLLFYESPIGLIFGYVTLLTKLELLLISTMVQLHSGSKFSWYRQLFYLITLSFLTNFDEIAHEGLSSDGEVESLLISGVNILPNKMAKGYGKILRAMWKNFEGHQSVSVPKVYEHRNT